MNDQDVKRLWWPLIWAFFYLSCVPFLYMGKKCSNKQWLMYGIIHLVLIGILYAMSFKFGNTSWYLLLLFTYGICGIVHTYLNGKSFSTGKLEAKLLKENPPLEPLTIVKPINLYPRIMGSFKGSMMKIMMWVSLPIWILTAVLVAIIADGFITGILAFIALLIGIAAAYILFSGGKYKPEKSFFFWRLSKERMSKLYLYFTIGGVIILALVSLYEFKVQNVFYLIAVLIALYAAQKSFAVHEDVDFVANMEVSDLIGMEVDEKIQASYLNFDTSNKPSDGSNIMLLTDKKLLFAFYDGSKWSLMNKFLKDIAKIGRINTEGVVNLTSSSSCLYVEFRDKTNLSLHMNLYDKLTSNPDLFFKKFLTILDAVVLGKTDEKIASRRRVSVNNEPKPSVSDNNENIDVRTIDISDTILGNLRDATPIESGRTLEF